MLESFKIGALGMALNKIGKINLSHKKKDGREKI